MPSQLRFFATVFASLLAAPGVADAATDGALVVRLPERARLSSDARSTGIAAVDAELARFDVARITPVFDGSMDPEAHRAAGLDRFYRIEVGAGQSSSAAAALLRRVESVEIEQPMRKLEVVPNDPQFSGQWALENRNLGWLIDTDIDCESAWAITTGSASLIVAILDTGIDLGHPEFAGRMVAGIDIVNGDASADDDEGHGTACAGIAAAGGNNGVGLAGVAWLVKIMPVKVLDEFGDGNTTLTAQGITWAADNGAKILSLSLGGVSGSPTLLAAVDYAHATKGCLLFCATGNDNDPSLQFPAAYTNAIGVGALSPCNERKSPSSCDGENWWGSNYGVGLEFLAPGVKINTTDIRGTAGLSSGDYYSSFNGTSAATPVAAGIAALVWSARPELTNNALLAVLRASCVDMGANGYDTMTGYGRINAANALESAFYSDVSSPDLSAVGDGRGVAWGDYDADGDADAYISYGSGQANRLLRNDAGVLENATVAPLGDTGEGRGVAWADYDNDGDLDLLVGNEGQDRLFRNDQNGFSLVNNAPASGADPTNGVAWADYDRDGDLDVYLVNYGTGNKLVRNDGGGVFTDVTAAPLPNGGLGNTGAWADSDQDGDLDLYLSNDDGPNRLFRNNGNGTFNGVTSAPMNDSNSGVGAAWGDFDDNGRVDLYLVNNDAPNRLFRSNGGNSWTDVAVGDAAWATDGAAAAWGDVDNDGDLDLFLTSASAPCRLLRNEGSLSFSSVLGNGVISAPVTGGRGAALADYDRDGDLDFLVVRSGAPSQLIRNDWPAVHHWLQVQLVGVGSNRDGIGARVRVKVNGKWRGRQIDGGSNFLSQNEPVAHFGLGVAGSIDSVEVVWPTGPTQQLASVGIDQRIVITQGVSTSVEGGARLDLTRLEPSGPNPFGAGVGVGETTVSFRLARSGSLALRVYATDGRLVRTLYDGERSAGLHSERWDGRDDGGRELAAGVYFVRLAAAQNDQRKLLLLR